MLPYWLLFSAYAFGAVNHQLAPRNPEMRSSPLFLGAALLTALFVGLRYQVGADWFNYLRIYADATRLSVDQLLNYGDPGYMIVNTFGHWLDADIWFVNVVCAAILLWGLVKFAQDQPNPWLTIAVAIPYLVIVVGMGYTRQAAAIGFLLASFRPFSQARYGRFVVLVVLAAAFHRSAFATLPLLALSTVRHRLVVYASAAAVGAIIFFLFLDEFLSRILASYFEREQSSDGAGVRVAMNVIPALIFLAFSRRFVLSEQERLIWRNFAIASLAMVVLLLVLPSSTVVDRVALYLLPIQLLVLSRMPYAFPRGDRPSSLLIIGVLAYSAAIQFVWLTYAKHAEAWLPYKIIPVLAQ